MQEVTHGDIEKFLSEANLGFKPGQEKVSFPIIQRICRRLQLGRRFEDSKVTKEGIITDGHHRYISLSILGIKVETVPAAKNITAHNSFEWNKMVVEANDYDTEEKILAFQEKYD